MKTETIRQQWERQNRETHEWAQKWLKENGLTQAEKDNLALSAAWVNRCVKWHARCVTLRGKIKIRKVLFKPFSNFVIVPTPKKVSDAEMLAQCIKTMSHHGQNSEQYKDARKTMMEIFRKTERMVNELPIDGKDQTGPVAAQG